MDLVEVRDVKKFSSTNDLKAKEGREILARISTSDYVILLDENGNQFTSVQFSKVIEKHQNMGVRNLVFIIGGAFGFSNELYQIANSKLALSKMTFSHQMIRVFFLEQLYRAHTIIRNEKYHNE